MPAQRSPVKHTATHSSNPYTKPPQSQTAPALDFPGATPNTKPPQSQTAPATTTAAAPAYPKGGKFRPEFENLDNETDDEYKAKASQNPYAFYKLHTGKWGGFTLKQV
ncbi:hypothetical protein BDV96DRAFT_654820 [Lophiotrema nucula]|uniref:Uncharacterized protein n=1 Tax=Lophiotrema nucula TaxID=690887 RepID=A0A6A5YIU9_9PLEO|nr:hypothetical protein BDV96DRAFT_654820 [Lophiotrema nucula]